MARHHHGGSVHTTASAIISNRRHDDIQEFRPAINLVRADEDLAESGTVNLDGRIVRILRRGVLITKNQSPPATIEDRSRAFMVSRVKPESFLGTTRGDERLD